MVFRKADISRFAIGAAGILFALGLINRAYSESHEISNRREARRRFIESHKQNEEQYGGTFGVGKTAHAHGTGPAQQRFGLSKGERLPLVGPMQQDRENKLQPAIGSGDRSVIKNIVEGAPVAEGEQTHILSEAPVVGKQGKTGVMHDEHRHMDGSLGEGSW